VARPRHVRAVRIGVFIGRNERVRPIPPPKTSLARLVLKTRADVLFFCAEATKMFDLLFVVVTIAFFAITLAYTTGCERL